jgi:peptidylprolyl isomerase
MRRYLLALPMLLAVLAFSACGSDDSSDESAATAAPTEEATQAPTEAPTETATADSGGSTSGSAVKVTGKLGEKPTIKTPGGDPPTKLVIKDIKKGTGAEAKAGQTVSVQYVGSLWKDGTVFDNSWDRGEAFSFPLGQGQVIPGWDQGVEGMKEGGRRVLTIPPELGYGEQGAGGAIGPNETLVFVVDLEKVTSP